MVPGYALEETTPTLIAIENTYLIRIFKWWEIAYHQPIYLGAHGYIILNGNQVKAQGQLEQQRSKLK